MVSGLTVFFCFSFALLYFIFWMCIFSRNVKKHNAFPKMFVFPLNEYNQLNIFIFIVVLGVLFNQ